MVDISRRNLLAIGIGGAAGVLSGGEAGAAVTARARTGRLDVEAATVPGGHMSALPEEIARSLAFFRDL
jgi:hypothetical protein